MFSQDGQPGDYEERLSQWLRLLRDSRRYATDTRQRKPNGEFREILGSIPERSLQIQNRERLETGERKVEGGFHGVATR